MPSGYLVGSFRIGETRKQLRLHRLVWIAANGVPPDGYVVCHRNNVKTDNRLENLYLATPAENTRDAVRDGLLPTGEENAATKIDAETRELIAHDYAQGEGTIRALAEKYGISKSRVGQIVKQSGWTEGISRTQRLKMLCNAVQVQAGELVGLAVVEAASGLSVL